MLRTRIYHGGPANTGSGGSGYSPPTDRLLDELGDILLQGISGIIEIKTGIEFSTIADFVLNVTSDLYENITGDAYVSADYYNIYSLTSIDIYATSGLYLTSDDLINIETAVPGSNIIIKLADNTGGVFLYHVKTGPDQATAGAGSNEIWIDTSDNSLKRGV